MSSFSKEHRRQIKTASIVILATVLLWLFATWLGGQLGWPTRLAFLFDFAALAAFLWSVIVLIRVWRLGGERDA